jgi:hypothetical protein
MSQTIESTRTVYDHNGIEHVRVFFAESNYFEDVDADVYPMWVEANGHTVKDSK